MSMQPTMLLHSATSWAYLADGTDTDAEVTKAGPIAVVVIIVLIVASFFLFKSMSKQLRKVRDNFPNQSEEPPVSGDPARPSRPTATSKSRASADDRRVTRPPNAGGPDPT